MNETQSSPRFAPVFTRLAASWLLAGALFKLFVGTPADLPALVRDVAADMGLGLGTTYRLAISIELCVGTLALFKPKPGWALLALQYVVFLVILGALLASGESNCGCFGSSVPVPPWAMMAVDGVLLLMMLMARPWRIEGRGLRWDAVFVLWLVCVGGTWALDREVAMSENTALQPDGVAAPEVPDSGWLELDVESWVGQELSTTPIANWIEPYEFPPDATWVLWRQTCDHCAEHLNHLADTDTGESMLVLLRLEEAHDNEANRVVYRFPEGGHVLHAELPASVEYVVTTPAEFRTEEWKVVEGEEGVEVDGH